MVNLSAEVIQLNELTEKMARLASEHIVLARKAANQRMEVILEAGKGAASYSVKDLAAECFLHIAQGRNEVTVLTGNQKDWVPFVATPQSKLQKAEFFAALARLLNGHLTFEVRPLGDGDPTLVRHADDNQAGYYELTAKGISQLSLEQGAIRWGATNPKSEP